MTQCKDQPYISVPKPSEFKSGPRVIKRVLNTQYHLYLWLTMLYSVQQQKTLKKSNRRFYYVNSAPELRNQQKPKNSSPKHPKTLFLPDDPVYALPAVSRLWPGCNKKFWLEGCKTSHFQGFSPFTLIAMSKEAVVD